MGKDFEIEKPKREPFEAHMKEAWEMVAQSILEDRLIPWAGSVTAKIAHVMGQKAGTDTLARLHKMDPDTDRAYENYYA